MNVRVGRMATWALLLLAISIVPTPVVRGQAKDDEKKARVPLTEVVLFTSGVGFFERAGKVNGNASVELKFDVKDINDLLKSMVVRDLGGGKVSTVSYASRDPIEKVLATFAIDLRSNPSLGDLLNQVRGEKVIVASPNKIEGTIVGVEKRTIPVGDKSITVEKLNILTAEGLRAVDLAAVQEIRLARPELELDLKRALAVLALGHDSDKKSVALEFRGQGERNVQIGYIAETPIWKTSYRMVVQEQGDLLLQGWAIVENTTEEDWNDVSLTLVSGRPISFIMDLYTPLYVDRPLVKPELYASLRPQTYGQSLEETEQQFRRAAVDEKAKQDGTRRFAGPAPEAAARPRSAGEGKGQGGGMMGDYGNGQGIAAMAQAGDVGELFRYVIDAPVKIARRQSAMLPIVNESITGEKLSIYNEQVHAKHPLNGLKLKNSTGLHLMQGPITVFDSGVYAGDAKIEDLAPGTERLISYAMDLDVEVAPEGKSSPEQMLTIKIDRGTLYVSQRAQQSRKYTIKNGGRKAKTVLIEHPKSGDWQLLSPKDPTETTRDRYRFAVQAEPGKAETIEVVESRQYTQTYAVNNLDDGRIVFYITRPIASEAVKVALQQVIKMKGELAQVVRQKQLLEQELAAISAEQTRIRQNMPQIDKSSDLFARYVKKFDEQEDRIEKVRGEIAELAKTEQAKRNALNDYLEKLVVE